jgi:hypothetical protein
LKRQAAAKKAKAVKAKKQDEASEEAEKPKSRAWLLVKAVGLLVAALGLLSSVAGLISFKVMWPPKLASAPRDPIDAKNETEFDFTVENTSDYDVDVSPSCIVSDAVAVTNDAGNTFRTKGIRQVWSTKRMNSGSGKRSLRCSTTGFMVKGPLQKAQIYVVLEGSKQFLHLWKTDRCARYDGTRTGSGGWTWQQQLCGDYNWEHLPKFGCPSDDEPCDWDPGRIVDHSRDGSRGNVVFTNY